MSLYLNESTLSHTLRPNKGVFTLTSLDLALYTEISLLSEGGVVLGLTIIGYQYEESYSSITFYTDNPFEFEI